MMKPNTSIPIATNVAARWQLQFVAIWDVFLDPGDPSKHGRAQISAIAKQQA